MTIIVTGAGGMLGQAVVRAAARADVEVHGFTRAELDITDQVSVTNATLRLPKPHIVINCAGIVRGRDDVDEPRRWLVNAVAPRALARRFERVVQVSTDCVFGGHSAVPYTEETIPTPTDWYGRSKAHGELTARPHVTVRGSFIGFEGGLLRWFLGQPVKAVVEGYDDHIWTGGYVEDYADALLAIALDHGLTGIVHLVGDTLTKGQLLQHLRFWLRPDIHIAQRPAPGGSRDMALGSTNQRVPRLPPWDHVLFQRMELAAAEAHGVGSQEVTR